MPTPLPLPVRVLVKGSSNVNWVSWMNGPRTDFAFPRVIEEKLLSEGRPCTVQTITMTSEQARTLLRTWQREILGFSPDVIILGHGHFEAVHLFLPRWLERHANSLKARPRRIPALYRKFFLRPVWKLLAQLQARVDSVVDPNIRRSRPRKVAADMERYISQVQKVGSPLIFCLEFPRRHPDTRAGFPECLPASRS